MAQRRIMEAIISTVPWQSDLVEALNERTASGEPTYFYEIDKLFDGMYGPTGNRSDPAFILSSEPMTDQEQLQLIAWENDEVVETILTRIKNHGGDPDAAKQKFIDAGVEFGKGAGAGA
jgi:hypothetical protein